MISVQEFVHFTNSDLKCSQNSEFPLSILKYKQFVQQVNETVENDKTYLDKINKYVKEIYNSGRSHSQNEILLSEYLEKPCQNDEDDFYGDSNKISAGLSKFAVVMRDLSEKYKQLMQNLNSLVVFPLDMFLKSDIKNDLKKPFEKALKDYEIKTEKLKKEHLNGLNKENLLHTSKPNRESLFNTSENLEKEKRVILFQLCNFLLKVNEIKARKGAELVQQLSDYYRAQSNYFRDCLVMIDHLGLFMDDIIDHVNQLKNRYDNENILLTSTRDQLKSIIDINQPNTEQNRPEAFIAQQPRYSITKPFGNKAFGKSKIGFLLKRSQNRVRRIWLKRRVVVSDESLMIYHSDDTQQPIVLSMLTCDIKHPPDGADHDNLCFDLISSNRTYNFRAENEKNLEEWLSVLNNVKEAAFERAIRLSSNDTDSLQKESSNYLLDDITLPPVLSKVVKHNKKDNVGGPTHNEKKILREIRKMVGNDKCADCDASDPEWVSLNLGILICLECCGVHRELGVHYSRTQSLRMDSFHCSQLLLPKFIGNKLFNEIFESALSDGIKPSPSSSDNRCYSVTEMHLRRSFILSKYVDRKFVNKIPTDNSKSNMEQDLFLAIQSLNIKSLLQIYGQGSDLIAQFNEDQYPETDGQMNSCLHLLLQIIDKKHKNEDKMEADVIRIRSNHYTNTKINTRLLVMVEFILQNSAGSNLKRINSKGNTALHQAVIANQLDVAKIILGSGLVRTDLLLHRNNCGQTAIDLAESLKSEKFISLFNISLNNTDKSQFNQVLDHLAIDWEIINDSGCNQENEDLLDKQLSSSYLSHQKSKGNNNLTWTSNNCDTDAIFNHTITTVIKKTTGDTKHSHMKHPRTVSHKSLFSVNTEEIFGIKASENPWHEMTFPRKRRIKCRPVSPGLKSLDMEILPNHSTSLNKTNLNIPKEEIQQISFTPNYLDKITDPSKSNKNDITLGSTFSTKSVRFSDNYCSVTFPRNNHSNHKKTLSSIPSQTDEIVVNNISHLSHSSDHIDIILDILEETKKRSNVPLEKDKDSGNHKSLLKCANKEISFGVERECGRKNNYSTKSENVNEFSLLKGKDITSNNSAFEEGWWDNFLEHFSSPSVDLPGNC